MILPILTVAFLVLVIFSVTLSRSSYKQSNKPAFKALLVAVLLQSMSFVVGIVSLHDSMCPLPSIFGYLVILFSTLSIVSLLLSFKAALKNKNNADRIAYIITLVIYLLSSTGAYFLSTFCLVF
jgi:FlaA1/EpsC-like NDP-sugar epimerase